MLKILNVEINNTLLLCISCRTFTWQTHIGVDHFSIIRSFDRFQPQLIRPGGLFFFLFFFSDNGSSSSSSTTAVPHRFHPTFRWFLSHKTDASYQTVLGAIRLLSEVVHSGISCTSAYNTFICAPAYNTFIFMFTIFIMHP